MCSSLYSVLLLPPICNWKFGSRYWIGQCTTLNMIFKLILKQYCVSNNHSFQFLTWVNEMDFGKNHVPGVGYILDLLTCSSTHTTVLLTATGKICAAWHVSIFRWAWFYRIWSLSVKMESIKTIYVLTLCQGNFSSTTSAPTLQVVRCNAMMLCEILCLLLSVWRKQDEHYTLYQYFTAWMKSIPSFSIK